MHGLSDAEIERYQWQLWTPGYSLDQQQSLKSARVLISRCGGVGGSVALHLAAAGIGQLILAHGGELRLNDLNRQLLMSSERVGQPRLDSAVPRLRDLNPHVQVVAVQENISPQNVASLVGQADLIVSAAPLFEERLLMNAAAVAQGKAIIHCSMYDLEAQVMVTRPRISACLACLSPTAPDWWRREFPVFGAVAGTAASIAAMEAIKLITGLAPTGEGLATIDFRSGQLRRLKVARDPDCAVCGQ
jgi:molybdopterin-synthase adenylyltransferase